MKRNVILFCSFLSIVQQLHAQQLLLDQKGISKNKIQEIRLLNENLFRTQEEDESSANTRLGTILTYDNNGRLLSTTMLHVEKNDTLYERNDLFVYVEGQLFMWVNKHKYCDEFSRAEHDGKCFTGYGFTLVEKDSAGVVLKNYGADEPTSDYLEFFFNGSQTETGMYMRDMEWRKRIRDIHHVDKKTKQEIHDELFISYSYTSDEGTVRYNEDTGDSTMFYARRGYSFSEADYATSNSFADFIPLDNFTMRKADIAFVGFDRKTIDKLRKYNIVNLSFFEGEGVEIILEPENQSGKGAKRN